jgi:hypothetical protein
MTGAGAGSRLAAIVFDQGDDPDAPLRAFIDEARHNGARISGLVQERGENDDSDLHDVRVRNLDTGAILPIMQDLGAQSEGCRVDPNAIASAAQQLAAAHASAPDLLVVNRFGRLESEGGGMIAEIGAAVAGGTALIICVPLRYRDAWNAFADGLDVQLPPRREAIAQWWASVTVECHPRASGDPEQERV